MINVYIDEFTPCLTDAITGEIVETEVVQITRRSFLSKYNTKTGWYTNWGNLLKDNEVYALVVKGTADIQGLVAVQPVEECKAVYISWMCTAPANNKLKADRPRYHGVGGHLFAVAIDKSLEYGYDGFVYGYAADEKLLNHYCNVFHALYVGMRHRFHFVIEEAEARKIKEAYTYEWTDSKI